MEIFAETLYFAAGLFVGVGIGALAIYVIIMTDRGRS